MGIPAAFWRGKARGRQPMPKGQMNKTEAAWEQVLELQKKAGQIRDYGFQRLKLKLADSTFYTPDFHVVRQDGELEIQEIKGFWEDDARVKIKVTAEQYPWLHVVAISRNGANAWKEERF